MFDLDGGQNARCQVSPTCGGGVQRTQPSGDRMNQHSPVRRGRRRASRGQSLVFVALSGVALMGIVGVALDGGMEAANYRGAQNAADAGALAARRLTFV